MVSIPIGWKSKSTFFSFLFWRSNSDEGLHINLGILRDFKFPFPGRSVLMLEGFDPLIYFLPLFSFAYRQHLIWDKRSELAKLMPFAALHSNWPRPLQFNSPQWVFARSLIAFPNPPTPAIKGRNCRGGMQKWHGPLSRFCPIILRRQLRRAQFPQLKLLVEAK